MRLADLREITALISSSIANVYIIFVALVFVVVPGARGGVQPSFQTQQPRGIRL
jgi:hypothetical protein